MLENLKGLSLILVLSLLVGQVKSGLLFLLLLETLSGESLESRRTEWGRLTLLLLLSLLLGDLVGLDLSLQKLNLLVLSGKELLLVRKINSIGVDTVIIGFGKTGEGVLVHQSS